jgi:eukaryotic-like serine/threonine-protein kinase
MAPSDRQLLFGVLALQLDFISVQQFAEVCTVWASRKDRSLPELLADRGWLKPQDHSDIESLLTRRIERHGGDVAASLREAGADERVKASLASIADEGIHRTLIPTPPPQGLAVIATRAFEPEGRDRYTLSRVHATGGIGRVWLAHDTSLRRDVALKELRPDRSSNEALWPRFLREARVTGQLEHPGIVPIYEVGQRPDDKAPFYTMRFIRGQTLAEAANQYHSRLAKGEAGPLELRKLLTAFIGTCNAVAYAHSRGVLHRDLKPQNVVLGAFGEVIVLDWGLAKIAGDDEDGPEIVDLGSSDGVDPTVMGQKLGTPSYMSPEQASGRLNLVSPKTDVYGLGAILYHILTNEPPFPAPTPDEAMNHVINDPVAPIRAKSPTTTASLEAVCLKALAKNPGDRYESATALAEEIQHWLADEPVSAHRESLRTRALRWARRHKTFVSAAAVFLVVSVIALGTASAMIYREQQLTEKEKKEVENQRTEAERNLAQSLRLTQNIVVIANQHLPFDALDFRRQLLETSLEAIARIEKDRPNDEQVGKTAALIRQHLPSVIVADDPQRAEAVLRETLPALEAATAKFPDDVAHATAFGLANFQLATILRAQGRRREAQDAARAAVKWSEISARQGKPDAIFNLASAYNELSAVQYGMEPMAVTEKTVQQAIDLLRALLKARGASATTTEQLYLSSALTRLANCRRESDRAKEGLECLNEASDITERLFVRLPRLTQVRHFRAQYWVAKGRMCGVFPERLGEAVSTFDQALVTWKGLPTAAIDRYAVQIAHAHARKAEIHRRLAQPEASETELKEAEKALKPIDNAVRKPIEYYETAAVIAACRTNLALDRKDAAAVETFATAAREAYKTLLQADPDNSFERDQFAKFERHLAEAKKRG